MLKIKSDVEIFFYMWPIEKKCQISATYANMLSWMGRGVFWKKRLRGCKSNRNFYRGENKKKNIYYMSEKHY